MSDGEVKEVTKKEFREMTDTEKAVYLLSQPTKMPSDNSREKWQRCLEFAQMRAHTNSIAEFWQDVAEKERRELEQAADRISYEDDFEDVSAYTQSGSFDAVRFVEDKRKCKTTWDGHILSAEDVQTARELMAQGTSKEVIHDTVRKKQHERLKIRTRMQADKINATLGKRPQPYCTMCMNRGYNAVIENEIFISLQICDCLRRYEQAMDKKREEEQKAKKRKGRKNDDSDEK